MALKDWKKGRFYNWTKTEKDGRISRVSFAEVYPERYWYVTAESYEKLLFHKKIRSKSQALKFAKQYMRTH